MKKIVVTTAVILSAISTSAFSAVDKVIIADIKDAGTDAGTLGSAVLVVLVGIFALKMLRKAL
jgi:hypothetical protein